MELPLDYVIQHLYTYCKRPTYKKNEGSYNAECCICNEGTSSGSKRRLFYFPSERYFYCFNCTRSWNEISWLQEVTKKSASELLREAKDFILDIHVSKQKDEQPLVSLSCTQIPVIPEDSIDILDAKQCSFYNDIPVIKDLILKADSYCCMRRLKSAINKPKSLFVSPKDYVHANRLVIPFYGESNKIESYQSRALLENTYPKYLTKYGEKCFYGENNIQIDIPYLFILEGPIDTMFVQNGLAIGGAKVTVRQNSFLAKHFDKEIIYIFDNDKDNPDMQKNVLNHIDQGKRVFIWPKELKQYKDINEVCCAYTLDHISTKFLLENSFKGIEASVKYRTSLKT